MNKLILIFHGYGGNSNSLEFLVKRFKELLNNCNFVLLEGVEDYEKNNNQEVGQKQWFSLLDLELNRLQINIDSNIDEILWFVRNNQKIYNVTNKDTILVGFSQGAMLAQYIALREMGEAYNAVVCFNGALIPPKVVCNKKTPIALISGRRDEVLEESYFIENCDFLESNSVPYKKILIDNLGHRISEKSISFCCEFLQEINKTSL